MSTPFNEHWLEMGACVPVDIETTAAFVAEIHRLIDVIGGMALAQAQEPVAWLNKEKNTIIWDKIYPDMQPLYTTPPQRTWVGLTDDERVSVLFDVNGRVLDYENYAEAIEAKLKEKNT